MYPGRLEARGLRWLRRVWCPPQRHLPPRPHQGEACVEGDPYVLVAPVPPRPHHVRLRRDQAVHVRWAGEERLAPAALQRRLHGGRQRGQPAVEAVGHDDRVPKRQSAAEARPRRGEPALWTDHHIRGLHRGAPLPRAAVPDRSRGGEADLEDPERAWAAPQVRMGAQHLRGRRYQGPGSRRPHWRGMDTERAA
uniref:Uncharacterized protein n=1 Tax=Zea mays TaxID=4577 RepID=C0PEP8_MAIZE|nr:unknown [Zea mays]|eukprot:NP_001169408.1 uncharacterized protein LOC100383277 [Zea mays]